MPICSQGSRCPFLLFLGSPSTRRFSVFSLLRHLRLPSRCRCQRLFDVLGDHVAPCAVRHHTTARWAAVGCLNGPLHVFAARPEQLRWSATLTSKLQDERRIEVIASEVPLWGGWFFCTSLPGTCYPGRMGFPMGLSRLLNAAVAEIRIFRRPPCG